jgi:hypothetical protein
MAGEPLPIAHLTGRGVLGDRLYALVDPAANRTATVRTWAAALLDYRPQFVTEPREDAPLPDVHITAPYPAPGSTPTSCSLAPSIRGMRCTSWTERHLAASARHFSVDSECAVRYPPAH